MNDDATYLGRNKIHGGINVVHIEQKEREERKAAGETKE